MDSFPDIRSMKNQSLKSLLDQLVTEEGQLAHEDSEEPYKLRVLHGKIDIVRGELVRRRRTEGGDDPGGSGGSPTREPPRPNPASGAGAIALPAPEPDQADACDRHTASRQSCPAKEDRARYLVPVETIAAGELVRVAGRGPDLDGIVFDVPSHSKVVVAVVEPGRGPTFRTVHPAAVTERNEAGADDRALRLLIGRTPSPVHNAARGGVRGERGRPGHTRAPTHRTTGR